MEKQNINQKEPMNEVKFADGSVPVAVAARVYGKEAHWVRAGIIVGWLPIGTATRTRLYDQKFLKRTNTTSINIVITN